jgi:Secretion system C-terminal sorting domain
MKSIYTQKIFALFVSCVPLLGMAQQPTTVVPSANCNFTYTFNTTDEGFSSPSIYSDANDFGMFWNGTQLAETNGSFLNNRTTSIISGIYSNTESNRTTLGFDYSVPAGTQYRVRIISGVTNPPLEILANTASGPIWTNLSGTSGSLCLELQDNDLPIAAQIRYEISFRTVTTGNITFDNFRRVSFNIPLPVTFLGFIARETATGSLHLLWNVADEVNVIRYEVETSNDGINFTSAGFVSATGKDNYSFFYTPSFKGVRYFRIKNIDIDNRYKYTGVIKFQNENAISKIKTYPNPASHQIILEHQKLSQKAIIQILSINGIMVHQTYSQTGSYQTYINIATLKPGVYLIKYDDGKGTIQTTTFVKN